MASDAPLICLRCDKEIPDESMTHRVVYVDDKGRLPPLDSWGSFTYHPECAAALRRERGVPQTHWTSPPRARPMVSDTDEQFPPGGYDKHGCACEDDPEYAKLLKRPPGCGPLEPPEDPRAIRVIAALSSEAATLRDELAAARQKINRYTAEDGKTWWMCEVCGHGRDSRGCVWCERDAARSELAAMRAELAALAEASGPDSCADYADRFFAMRDARDLEVAAARRERDELRAILGGGDGQDLVTMARYVRDMLAAEQREYGLLQNAVAKFLNASGHDLCHENRVELADAAGLFPGNPTLPPECEFTERCEVYRKQIYGAALSGEADGD